MGDNEMGDIKAEEVIKGKFLNELTKLKEQYEYTRHLDKIAYLNYYGEKGVTDLFHEMIADLPVFVWGQTSITQYIKDMEAWRKVWVDD